MEAATPRPERKPATVYDVAREAGVSIATVSSTFRRPDIVREATRRRVVDAANQLGYVPSANARGLAKGRTSVLGLLSYDYFIDDPATDSAMSDANHGLRDFPLYVDEVQRGMELECWQRGYALMIGGGPGGTSLTPATDIAGRVDGLAVFPQTLPRDELVRVARNTPVVALSEPPRDDALSHVAVDNRGGSRSVTEHLIKVHGARRLLFVGGLNPAEASARFEGFRDALEAAHLPVPGQPLVPADYLDDGPRPTFDLPDIGELPDAFVCSTDEAALVLMERLAEQGVRVPQDVAVTGFDGIAAGRVSIPALTTVRQPMIEIGRSAVRILIDMIEARDFKPATVELPVSLVVRSSCGCR